MSRSKIAALSVAAAVGGMMIVPAWAASTLSASFFKVVGDPAFGTQCCGTYGDMVTGTLGPDGLPVLNTSAPDIPVAFMNTLKGDLNSNGELTWWTPGPHVTATGSSTVSLPFSSASMYPPAATPGGNDANGYLSAMFTGIFSLATASMVNFSLGADDDAFFYVDNTLVNSIGGIHGDTPAPVTTTSLGQGTHTIKLFYDDRQPSAAALDFNLTSQGITIIPSVPEPSTFALLGVGLTGLGFLRRRSKCRSEKS
ncbi:MAG: PEP-CTERM sorting domain-containing protein [Caldimonas sp.]